MKLTPEQLIEISMKAGATAFHNDVRNTDDCLKFAEHLFAEFQKLQDSRISDLELMLAAQKDEWGKAYEIGMLAIHERDQLAAKLKAMEEQEPVAWMYPDQDGPLRGKVFVGGAKQGDIPLYAAPVATSVTEGYALVPEALLDQFPEINPLNYDHDDVCALNAWCVELVLSASPGRA